MLKSTEVHSFQLKEAITVRDFDDRGIILIQVGYFFIPRVSGATKLGRSVACTTFQRFRIGFMLNAFLVKREC